MSERDERIEKYLNGEMEAAEKTIFEKEILVDKGLKEQIELKKDLIAFFKSRNPELDKKLNELGKEFFAEETLPKKILTPNYILLLGVVLLLLSGLYYYYFIYDDSVENTSIELKEIGKESINPSIIKGSEFTEESITNSDSAKSEESILPTIDFSDELPIVIDRPVAQYENYTENPNFEALIKESIRSNDGVEFKLLTAPEFLYLVDGKVNLKVKGETNKTAEIELVIYNNNPDNFDKDIRVLSNLIKSSFIAKGKYEIKFNANIPFEKGLYYYFLQNKKSKELLSISKFYVK